MQVDEAIQPVKRKRAASGKAKGLGLKQLFQKKYKMLEGLPESLKRSFGEMTEQILMIIYGPSSNGKSRLTMQFLKIIMRYGDVLYWALEEGHRRTMQKNAEENLTLDEHSGKITFWDHNLTFEELVVKLKKKKSAKFVVIDSLQYVHMNMDDYKYLKEHFPNKGFIFISHNKGSKPDGKLACKIEFDVDIKVRVEGFVAFVKSRYGGNKPYVIWEGEDATKGAWGYWGKKKVNQFKK